MRTAKNVVPLSFLIVLGVVLASCRPGEPAPPAETTAAAPDGATVYRVRGIIRKVKNEGRIAVIDHEEIPEYMEAMVMPFHAKEGTVFAGVKPGDRVEFDYHVRETEAWVENVTVTGTAEIPDEESESGGGGDASILKPGEALPDLEFVDQDGLPRRLSDFRGMTVALTFIFTRCPAPEFCPRMMRQFAETARVLSSESGTVGDWHLLTISFDPENDTPAVLKAYGEAYDRDPSRWTLLVGDRETTEAIAAATGLRYGRKADTGSYEHNLRTLVVTPEGVISRLFTEETWTPDQLAAAMREAGSEKPAVVPAG